MALKPEWKKFIREMNKTGDKIEAYLKAFPKVTSRKSAATSAERLLKKAEIQQLLKINPDIQQKAQQKVVDELAEEIKVEVLTAVEKRAILRKIANGDLDIPEYFVKRDGTVGNYKRKPDAIEIIKAIETDNRMAGHDAPQKHEVDHNITGIDAIYKKALQVKSIYGKKESTNSTKNKRS